MDTGGMKHFLIIGNKNALFWKDIFPLFMEGRLRFGYNHINCFILPDNAEKWEKIEGGKKLNNYQGTGRWFTDMPVNRQTEPIEYTEGEYPRYDTYDAVNTDSRTKIPDTDGVIGVPIDFLDIMHPQQFEIVGELMNGAGRYDYARPIVEGKKKYTRLLIKRV